MSLLVWTIAFGTLGLLVWVAGGVLIAPVLPARWRHSLGDWYFKQAAAAAWRPLFVAHSAGFEYCASEFDGTRLAESVVPFGDRLDYEDAANLMGRWHGRPTGFVEVGVNAVTTPLHVHVGARDADMYRGGDDTVAVKRGGGDEDPGDEYTRGDVPLEPGLHAVDMTRWHESTPYSTQPSDAETTERFAYLSQLGFNTRSTVEVMLLAAAFVIGIGGVWALSKFGDVGSVNFNIYVDAARWLLWG